MKTAIYIEDGITQIVLTPESEFEKEVIAKFGEDAIQTKIYKGAFYDCRGGWVRQKKYFSGMYGESEDTSIILIVNTKKE